jgi:hypothetical protein
MDNSINLTLIEEYNQTVSAKFYVKYYRNSTYSILRNGKSLVTNELNSSYIDFNDITPAFDYYNYLFLVRDDLNNTMILNFEVNNTKPIHTTPLNPTTSSIYDEKTDYTRLYYLLLFISVVTIFSFYTRRKNRKV